MRFSWIKVIFSVKSISGVVQVLRWFSKTLSVDGGSTENNLAYRQKRMGNQNKSTKQSDQDPSVKHLITLFLCGDVMTGRGVDQILPHPCDAQLYESFVTSAQDYVELAERANGPISRPVRFEYVWGEALAALSDWRPDLRIINLETAITAHSEPYPKGINYRMSPANLPCLTAAGIDCCTLANNHVLDWGRQGLADTLESLRGAGIQVAGAGHNVAQARAPAINTIGDKGRVLLFGFGARDSGVPSDWAAGPDRAGVNILENFSPKVVAAISRQVGKVQQPSDLLVASIHWGPNWGYGVAAEHQVFAHDLIERAGFHIIHGHSSHHVMPIEVWQDRLILYGCGDFLNDYEGIGGYETYRGDLVLSYFPTIDLAKGILIELAMVPMRINKMQLTRASREDALWLRDLLNRKGGKFGIELELEVDNTLYLRWQ